MFYPSEYVESVYFEDLVQASSLHCKETSLRVEDKLVTTDISKSHVLVKQQRRRNQQVIAEREKLKHFTFNYKLSQ